MKFGEYLKEGKNPEWTHSYLDYDKLKTMISDLMEAHVGAAHDTGRGASLSVARPTNAAGMPLGAKEDHVTQEQFFSFIEQEIRKIDMFTKKQVRLRWDSRCENSKLISMELHRNRFQFHILTVPLQVRDIRQVLSECEIEGIALATTKR